MCGHEKGSHSPIFACHECDYVTALLGEKNRMQIGLESAAWQAYHPRVRWQCPRAWVGIYAYMASSTRKGAMPELAGNIHGILSIYKHSPVCDTLVCMVRGPVNGRPTSTLYGWVQLNDCIWGTGKILTRAPPGICQVDVSDGACGRQLNSAWGSPSALQYCWSAYSIPALYI